MNRVGSHLAQRPKKSHPDEGVAQPVVAIVQGNTSNTAESRVSRKQGCSILNAEAPAFVPQGIEQGRVRKEQVANLQREGSEEGDQFSGGEEEGRCNPVHIYHSCGRSRCDPLAHVKATTRRDSVCQLNRFDRLEPVEDRLEECEAQAEEQVVGVGQGNRRTRKRKKAGRKRESIDWKGEENQVAEEKGKERVTKRDVWWQAPERDIQLGDGWREEDERFVDEYIGAENQQVLAVANVVKEMEGDEERDEGRQGEAPRGTLLWDLVGLGSRWFLVYLDTGCAMDMMIDPAFRKQLEDAGVPMVWVKQGISGVGVDGSRIECQGAVRMWVTRGNNRARLTVAVTKKEMALGAILGRPALTKLGWVIDTTDPRYFAIPGQDGRPQRARPDPYNYGLETTAVVSVPPKRCVTVFGVGQGLPDAVVGSEAIAERHPRALWPVANTLTVVRKDSTGRTGAQVCVSNPAEDKWLVIPRGVPVARLGVHWRKGVASVPVVPGKEDQGAEIPFQPPDNWPIPICPLLRDPESGEGVEREEREEEKKERPLVPEWMMDAVELRMEKRRASGVEQSEGDWEREREELNELAYRAASSLEAAAAERGQEAATAVAEVLLRYPKVFAPRVFANAGGAKVKPMEIRLIEGAKPSAEPPRRMSWHRRELIRDLVKSLLEQGVISPSNSPWASPIVLTIKQDGSPRMCIDYRKLNCVTERDSFPLPRMDDLLDRLGESTCRSTLDLQSGYHQIPMREADKEKTAFAVSSGLYQFNCLPFGLKNGPAVFQRIMHDTLAGIHYIFALCYLDDIIVFSRSLENHLDHLDQVLQRLEKANLQVKLSKCAFLQRKIKYLGHVVTDEGVGSTQRRHGLSRRRRHLGTRKSYNSS